MLVGDRQFRDERVGIYAAAQLSEIVGRATAHLPFIEKKIARPSNLATEENIIGNAELLGEIKLLMNENNAGALRRRMGPGLS